MNKRADANLTLKPLTQLILGIMLILLPMLWHISSLPDRAHFFEHYQVRDIAMYLDAMSSVSGNAYIIYPYGRSDVHFSLSDGSVEAKSGVVSKKASFMPTASYEAIESSVTPSQKLVIIKEGNVFRFDSKHEVSQQFCDQMPLIKPESIALISEPSLFAEDLATRLTQNHAVVTSDESLDDKSLVLYVDSYPSEKKSIRIQYSTDAQILACRLAELLDAPLELSDYGTTAPVISLQITYSGDQYRLVSKQIGDYLAKP